MHLKSTKLHFERKGSGEPIIFLHGLGSCGADWLYQIPEFSKKYSVFTPDLRGHGASDKNGPFSIQTSASDIKELIENLRLGSVHLVGLSYGSFVALQLAAEYPELVKSLTLVGTTSNIINMHIWKMILRRILLFFCPMTVVGKVIAKSLFPEPQQEAIRKVCANRIASNNKKVYQALLSSVFNFNANKRLQEIRCPTLLIVGEKDSLLPISHAKKIEQAIPRAKLLVIPGARHAVPLDSPEEFNHILKQFLETV